MKRIAKWSLARMITERGSISFARTLDVITQVATALEVARAQGIVVTDLDPATIFLKWGTDVEIRGASFGQPDQRLTSPPRGGRSRYMAPEEQVAATQDADERADQFSLAVIAFEMLSGRPPFTEDDLERATDAGGHLAKRQFRLPPPLTKLVAGLPPSLEGVLLRAMSFDPHERFPHVDDFIAAMRATTTLTAQPAPVAEGNARRDSRRSR